MKFKLCIFFLFSWTICSWFACTIAQGVQTDIRPTDNKEAIAAIKKILDPEKKVSKSRFIDSDFVVTVIFTLLQSEILCLNVLLNNVQKTGNYNDCELKILLDQLHPLALVKNFLHTYPSHFFTTLAHELGHAFAAKMLNDDPIDIHLGQNSNYTEDPLFKIGGISFDGFNPLKGYAKRRIIYKDEQEKTKIEEEFSQKILEYTQALQNNLTETELRQKACELIMIIKNKKINRLKTGLISLAGGTAGIIAHFFTKSIMHAITSNAPKSFLEKIKEAAVTEGLKIDDIYVHQIMNLLMPYIIAENNDPLNFLEQEKTSDGAVFWEQAVGVPRSVIKNTADYAALPIDLTAQFYVARKEAQSKNSSLVSQALISLINQNLRGFLHFHD